MRRRPDDDTTCHYPFVRLVPAARCCRVLLHARRQQTAPPSSFRPQVSNDSTRHVIRSPLHLLFVCRTALLLIMTAGAATFTWSQIYAGAMTAAAVKALTMSTDITMLILVSLPTVSCVLLSQVVPI